MLFHRFYRYCSKINKPSILSNVFLIALKHLCQYFYRNIFRIVT